MSVIAKLSIRDITDFGSGRLVEMGCVCSNDLMSAYAESEEDKLFTKYSPWGEIKLHQPSDWIIGFKSECFYVVITRKDEVEEGFSFPGAVAHSGLRIVSISDFGDGQAKRLEMVECGKKGPAITSFNWKMSVDNPAVFAQLKAGSEDYHVAFYPATKFDRDAAIRAAHGVI